MDYTAHFQSTTRVLEDELPDILSSHALKFYLAFQEIGASNMYHIMPEDLYTIDGYLYNPARLTKGNLNEYLEGIYALYYRMLTDTPEYFTEQGREFFKKLYAEN